MAKEDPSTRTTAETITPLNVPIKAKRNGKDSLRSGNRFGIIILTCAFIVLITAGTFFLHYLSKNPIQPNTAADSQLPEETKTAEKVIETPEEKSPPVDPDQLAADKDAAEQKLAEFLEAKSKLDQMGAQEWGRETYARMNQMGLEADSHLMDNEYRPAADKYDRATVIAGELAARSADELRGLLEEGSQALNEGNGVLAQKKFSLALTIDPASPSARSGLKRARTIETVMQLVASGERHEKDKALIPAQAQYRKALEIDPDFKEAQQALKRVTHQIKAEQFQHLMSAGLSALNNNDYRLARSQLLQAKSLKPESREVADALIQVDQAVRLARIDKLRKDARTAEGAEDWQAALKSYLAVLDIDKNLQFAARGKKRALEQIQIAKRLHFFIRQPHVLESDSQLKDAVRLLKAAKEIRPQGSKLVARIEDLTKLVAVAQTTVKVTLESDNLTQVAVYRVGKLGRFLLYDLELRPGTYTVVGARDGYKDVRRKFVVTPDRQTLRVTSKCRVKI